MCSLNVSKHFSVPFHWDAWKVFHFPWSTQKVFLNSTQQMIFPGLAAYKMGTCLVVSKKFCGCMWLISGWGMRRFSGFLKSCYINYHLSPQGQHEGQCVSSIHKYLWNELIEVYWTWNNSGIKQESHRSPAIKQKHLNFTPIYVDLHAQLWSHVRLFGDPMGCNLPDSSVHGIFLARILEWIAISFSRGIYLYMYTFYPSIGMKIEIKCSKRELSVLSSSYSCDVLKCSPTLSFPNIQPPPCES